MMSSGHNVGMSMGACFSVALKARQLRDREKKKERLIVGNGHNESKSGKGVYGGLLPKGWPQSQYPKREENKR